MITLDNGMYVATIRQLVDPSALPVLSAGQAHFEIVLAPAGADELRVEAISHIWWSE